MTDRELLELAARAAGCEPGHYEDGAWFEIRYGTKAALWLKDEETYWNPLEDDGDALRLAVTLQLTVCNEQLRAGCAYCTNADDETFPTVQSGTNEDGVIAEDYAATRRAIVMAAAEIARAQAA